MLNSVWGGILLVSVLCAVMQGNVSELNNALFAGAESSVKLVISLCGTICFWSGIMHIAEKSGLTRYISKALSPLLGLLFKNLDSKASSAIGLNITANLLGISNAATPFGLKAMDALSKRNDNPLTASDDMITFVVINTASFQLVPTTIAALRAKCGSAFPMEIAPCIWISSLAALVVGVTLAKSLGRVKKI